jgi:hypothetical protein
MYHQLHLFSFPVQVVSHEIATLCRAFIGKLIVTYVAMNIAPEGIECNPKPNTTFL